MLAGDLSQPMHPSDCWAMGEGSGSRHGSPTRSTRSSSNRTLFTERKPAAASSGFEIAQAPSRPALVVSSTSWTPAEDFGILLEAAMIYDKMTHNLSSYPRLLFVITGKGPLK